MFRLPTKISSSFLLSLLTLAAVFVLIITGDVDANVGLPIIVAIGGGATAVAGAAAGYQNGKKPPEEKP